MSELLGVREVVVWPNADDPDRASFTLDEGETVLESEYRGANRLVLAIATPRDGGGCGVCGCVGSCEHGCCS